MPINKWPFVGKPSDIKKWFNNKGHTGTVYEAACKYFQTKAGSIKSDLYDDMRKHLFSLGYVGSLNDQLNKFFLVKNGGGQNKASNDCERAFWKNLGGDFS